jgi:hypothetical protein
MKQPTTIRAAVVPVSTVSVQAAARSEGPLVMPFLVALGSRSIQFNIFISAPKNHCTNVRRFMWQAKKTNALCADHVRPSVFDVVSLIFIEFG